MGVENIKLPLITDPSDTFQREARSALERLERRLAQAEAALAEVVATPTTSGSLSDGDYGDITVSGGGTAMAIDAGAVTTTELGGDITTAGKALLDDTDAAAQRTTLGLGTAATQASSAFASASHTHSASDITSGTLAAAQMPALTGDVTTSAGAVATAIANNAVTLAKMEDIATARFIGRTTAGTGDPEALTGTQATALLDAFTSGAKGLVPASGGGTATYLRADGTFASPTGTTGTNSVTVTNVGASPATLNVTTEGTIDWHTNTDTTHPWNQSTAGFKWKLHGGWIAHSWDWVTGGTGATVTTFGSQQPALTSTASDSAGGALSSQATFAFMQVVNATATGFGYKFRVPADLTSRTLTVYTMAYSCEIEVKATLNNVAATTSSATQSYAAGASGARKFTVVYSSQWPCDLTVSVLVKTNNHDGGNSLNMGMAAATLAYT